MGDLDIRIIREAAIDVEHGPLHRLRDLVTAAIDSRTQLDPAEILSLVEEMERPQ